MNLVQQAQPPAWSSFLNGSFSSIAVIRSMLMSFSCDNYSYQGTLFSIYSQSEALQYLLLMWLMLIITILVPGIATGYFLKRKDSRG